MGQTPGGKQRRTHTLHVRAAGGGERAGAGAGQRQVVGSRPLREPQALEKHCSIPVQQHLTGWLRKPGFLQRQSLTTFTVFHMLTGQHSLMTSVQINFLVKQILENLILLLLI